MAHDKQKKTSNGAGAFRLNTVQLTRAVCLLLTSPITTKTKSETGLLNAAAPHSTHRSFSCFR